MTYQETLTYLDSFINYEKKTAYPYKESWKLERVKEFLALIGNPQDHFKSIHIAGTKGKGSVCAFTAYMLKGLGFSVGLYTSPHLTDVRERIRIIEPRRHTATDTGSFDFEGMIVPEELVSLVVRLKPTIDTYCRRCEYGPLSFFEVYTALAFTYFQDKKVDFAVLETGLGGRLDATNVVDPLICGITSISYDHMNKLGNTLTEIAREKAGIIKSHRACVITAPQENEVLSVLRTRCKEYKASLYEVGTDITIDHETSGEDSQTFSLRTAFGAVRNLKIRLLGHHQVVNAALAVSLVLALARQKQLRLDSGLLRKGLYETLWPARFEIAARQPSIILDSAHNVASAHALRKALAQYAGEKKIILLLGISKDKDIRGICRALFPVSRFIILTRAANPRAANPKKILQEAAAFVRDREVIVTASVRQALMRAREKATVSDVIVVAGSIFVAGEARQVLRKQDSEIIATTRREAVCIPR